jgi:hypothetical protein
MIVDEQQSQPKSLSCCGLCPRSLYRRTSATAFHVSGIPADALSIIEYTVKSLAPVCHCKSATMDVSTRFMFGRRAITIQVCSDFRYVVLSLNIHSVRTECYHGKSLHVLHGGLFIDVSLWCLSKPYVRNVSSQDIHFHSTFAVFHIPHFSDGVPGILVARRCISCSKFIEHFGNVT